MVDKEIKSLTSVAENMPLWEANLSAIPIRWTGMPTVPEVALFPWYNVKYCGDDEEGTEAHAINPCCYLLPAVVRQPMEEGAAHKGRNNEELRERDKKQISQVLPNWTLC